MFHSIPSTLRTLPRENKSQKSHVGIAVSSFLTKTKKRGGNAAFGVVQSKAIKTNSRTLCGKILAGTLEKQVLETTRNCRRVENKSYRTDPNIKISGYRHHSYPFINESPPLQRPLLYHYCYNGNDPSSRLSITVLSSNLLHPPIFPLLHLFLFLSLSRFLCICTNNIYGI